MRIASGKATLVVTVALMFVVLVTLSSPLAHAQTVVAEITVGAGARSAAYDPHTGEIFVPNNSGDSVSVISGSTVAATVNGFDDPRGLVYDSGTKRS